MHDIRAIASHFDIPGELKSTKLFGTGHINDSYALTFTSNAQPTRYLLQRINHDVFHDVAGLMSNIAQVCQHIRAKLRAADVTDIDRRVMTLIPTIQGRGYHQDTQGRGWRVYRFIEAARSYDVVESPRQAFAAAQAFGRFQNLLADLPPDRLTTTIPDFHHTPKRVIALEHALEADPLSRADQARSQIDWLYQHQPMFDALLQMRDRGQAIERIAHHDTKLGNVLLDDHSGEAICVIDLDTVMPGLSLYDFADLVRSSTSPVAEDEPDVSKVTMQLPMFDAITRGYLTEAAAFLTPDEIRALPLSAMVLTLTIGIRFLTDFIQGDRYYKTQHPLQNLHRCRTQFALVDSMQQQEAAMQQCVDAAMVEHRGRA